MMRLLLQVVITTATFGDSPAPTPEPDPPPAPVLIPIPTYSPDLAATYTLLHLKPRLPAAPTTPIASVPRYVPASSIPAASRIILPRPPDPPSRPSVTPQKPTPSQPPASPVPPAFLVFGPTATMEDVAIGVKNSTLASAPAWSLKHDGINTVVTSLPAALPAAPIKWDWSGTEPLSKSGGYWKSHFQGAGWWFPGETYTLHRIVVPGNSGSPAVTHMIWPHCHVISTPALLSAMTPEEHHCNGPVTP